MTEYAVQVEGLSKRYFIGAKKAETYQTLRDTLVEGAAAPLRRVSRLLRGEIASAAVQDEAIWALKDVSFNVKQGEVVGIIGANGAGKSTLLKILSRITVPTEGQAIINGRLGSLLEVGTGFHPELTGRENIFLNGAILGMRRQEIARKLDEIVEFSGVEQFLDTPVKRYSSGMLVRLAFAVAAHLEPEILVIDEVLSVGDAAFQKKSMGKMGEVAESGRTVLFVSHNMAAVESLCTWGIVLQGGSVIFDGSQMEAIRHYLNRVDLNEGEFSLKNRTDRMGNGDLRYTNLTISDGNGSQVIVSGGSLQFVLDYEVRRKEAVNAPKFAIHVADMLETRLFTCYTEHAGAAFTDIPLEGKVICNIPNVFLLPGTYLIDLGCKIGSHRADYVSNAGEFVVVGDDFFGSGKLPNSRQHGPFLVSHSWHLESL